MGGLFRLIRSQQRVAKIRSGLRLRGTVYVPDDVPGNSYRIKSLPAEKLASVRSLFLTGRALQAWSS